MPPELLSFLNKIPNDKSSQKLEWSGFRVDKTLKQLQSKLNLSLAQLYPLAILLQYLDIGLFTEEELLSILTLNLGLLTSKSSGTVSKKSLSSSNPLVDTGSSRLYTLINFSQVTSLLNSKRAESYIFSNSNNLRELIINLYNKGY